MLLPEGHKLTIAASAGKIASNFTGDLSAIHNTLETYFNLFLAQKLNGINIFSDSRSALQSICKISSSLVINIISLLEQVNCLHKYCVLQWIPANINFEFNESADSFVKSARNLDHTATPSSTANVNAYAKSKVIFPSKIELKHQITQLNSDKNTAITITRLRMKHH